MQNFIKRPSTCVVPPLRKQIWPIITDKHREDFLGYKIFLGLIELVKWRRNKEKLKKYVVDTNYYYNKNRDSDEYYESNMTDNNDYYESTN